MKKHLLFILAFLLILSGRAQDGSLDTSFNFDGVNFGEGANSTVYDIALLPDGKILIAGDFTSYNGIEIKSIARLNSDGSLDNSFNPGTGLTGWFPSIRAIALQSDGKILIGGNFNSVDGVGRNNIARLNGDGSVDTSFDPGTGASAFSPIIYSLAIQPDGKILAGGDFNRFNGTTRNGLVRLNTDGSLDTSFDIGLGVSGLVRVIVIQPDGNIVIGGQFLQYNGIPRRQIARINSDGSLDTSFDPGTGFDGMVTTLNILPDNNILVGGYFVSYNNVQRIRVARLFPEGNLDTSYDLGSQIVSLLTTLVVQPDGKIIVAGGTSMFKRFDTNGDRDLSFDSGTGVSQSVVTEKIVLQPDGKVLVGGQFRFYNGVSVGRIMRVLNTVETTPGTEPPVPDLETLPDLTAECVFNVGSLVAPTATAEDGSTITGVTDESIFPISQQGTTVIVWTYTDENGLESTQEQQVIIEDVTPPTITVPAEIIVNANSGQCFATGVNLGTPVTTDNCGIGSVVNNAPGNFPVGLTEVLWTVTDVGGNTTQAIQVVTVIDNQLPVITEIADIEVSTDPGTCTATGVSLSTPNATDNCAIASLTNDAPEVFELGPNVVTWTATDPSGNETTKSFTVTVVDNELPTIIAPADLVVVIGESEDAADNVELGSPEAEDNCGVESVSNDAPLSFPLGTTTVIWKVTDDSGNTATAEQTVTVTREVLPTITAPTNITVATDGGSCEATGIDLGTPEVTGEDIPADGISNDAPDSFPVGTTTVTWTVTDGNGNTATAQQTVTVNDEEKPVIAAVSDITRSTDPGICEAEIEITAPAVSDNCDSPVATGTRSDGLDLDAPYPVGITLITWTATDAAGNEADEVVQSVTVEDTEAPEITAPANISIQLQEGEESATDVDLGVPTTSDNCGVDDFSNDAPASFAIGTTTVTWTVTDVNGNTATDTQTVTVLPADTETELPTVTAPADVLVDTDKGICEATDVDLGIATFTGDIPDGGLGNDAPASFPLGESIVTWTVTDRNGNTATAIQKVTVRDRELPVIKAPSDLVLGAPSGGLPASEVDLGEPDVSDNCSIAEVRNNAPAVFPIGTTTVTWTVIDGSGNRCTAKQKVTVNLTEEDCKVTAKAKPVVKLKLSSQGKARLTTEMADDGSTASCGTLKLDLSECNFSCEDIGENTVRLIAKDGKGNRDEVEFTVLVVDETKPKIKVDKRAFVWMMKAGDTFTMPDFRDRVEASDNCGFELTQCPEPGTKFRKAENIFVEFEAKDPSGNKATDKFRFNLLVFKCKVPNKNGRTTGEQELSDMLVVPWNTAFDKAINESIVFEEGSDPEYISRINWKMNDYNPIRPGMYRITASIENTGFEGWDVSLDIPVIVQDKPLAEDIMISRNKVSTKVRSGEIIGSLNTLDPVDNIHSYSMDDHPDFYIDRGVLVWRGSGAPDAQMTITVHSTDRAGQTISRELTLYRELAKGEILIYPNPAKQETNVLVQLSGAGTVGIRVFDAAGRLVYMEEQYQEGSFVRNLDLKGLSSGMYQVVVQSGNEVMTGRLIKEE